MLLTTTTIDLFESSAMVYPHMHGLLTIKSLFVYLLSLLAYGARFNQHTTRWQGTLLFQQSRNYRSDCAVKGIPVAVECICMLPCFLLLLHHLM
eukprot:m.189553 g.189553  ORF g.189553 m.189553 type:complete len:94 (-) comp14795_c0_seq2:28-309(-)